VYRQNVSCVESLQNPNKFWFYCDSFVQVKKYEMTFIKFGLGKQWNTISVLSINYFLLNSFYSAGTSN
jgi:hypothetical protein